MSGHSKWSNIQHRKGAQDAKRGKIFTKHILIKEPETLYLKHVDLLSNENQKNLLFVLEIEQNKFCRIIASTRKSLFHAMREEQFNTSLFYHLNRAPLEVPPLRKRAYDIPLLLNYYLSLYSKQYKKTITLNTKSIRQLKNNQWPGNVTELKSLLQQLVIINDSYNVIAPEQLESNFNHKKPARPEGSYNPDYPECTQGVCIEGLEGSKRSGDEYHE